MEVVFEIIKCNISFQHTGQKINFASSLKHCPCLFPYNQIRVNMIEKIVKGYLSTYLNIFIPALIVAYRIPRYSVIDSVRHCVQQLLKHYC